ncbi:hypothetical protein CC1G_04966 [Coprinopsis cinerea okayama7|uniref:thioredoxin-dependent peroxiredoxin n=1 Tax=Coprinopsis cinerea (strain Okayama-7 / 130 / ATCC MYA-4618 / FGSC 9003) TaxID=240176 RepID=A8NSB8_COPC7|nr:hypothetical protein CC1G_04966 [Coprinopsis cinerea okayama7\|eukprot:XP_001835973.1 hypothetical protein CC1G_04966 [Coprinopsis cinerea okayama7\
MSTFADLIGKEAPAFSLPNHDGDTFEFKPGASGRPTAILFYPESGSYGCTQQICQFRDAVVDKVNFNPDRVQIIGISANTVEKQKGFVEKHSLPFPILSDVKKEAVAKYRVPRGMAGLVPVARVTFVIDSKGVVRDALDTTMNYGAHQGFVEKWLTKLEGEESKSGATARETTAAS